MTDIRWKQRFDNFSKALVLLRSAMEDRPLDAFSDLEKEGLVQRFEYTYELAWKTMKDYMEDGGLQITPVTPRQVIKEAFAARLIEDGQDWIDMMLHRNLLAHTYDKIKFREVLDAVAERYLRALGRLHGYFQERL